MASLARPIYLAQGEPEFSLGLEPDGESDRVSWLRRPRIDSLALDAGKAPGTTPGAGLGLDEALWLPLSWEGRGLLWCCSG